MDADLLEHLDHQRLDEPEHQIDVRERNLDVHLRELRLTIGAQVFVAEALDDLEVPVNAGNHQDLLEQLRRLRQREELSRVHAARHQVVARAFGRRLAENRRLDLPEAVGVEILADRHRHAVPQPEIALKARPAQIEIAVAQSHVFADQRVVGDGKRRRLCLVQQPNLVGDDLHFAGVELHVHRLGITPPHWPEHGDDVLGAELFGLRHQRAVIGDHHLCDAVAVAHVEKQQATEITDAMHPAEEHGVSTDVRQAQRAAGVGAGKGAQGL